MEFFEISIPGLRIAGGLMVARIGFTMLKPSVDEKKSKEAKLEATEAIEKDDISFTPLAMPSMSGPGSIAVTIGLATQTRGVLDFSAVIVGFLLLCVGVQFIVNGIVRIITDPETLQKLADAWQVVS